MRLDPTSGELEGDEFYSSEQTGTGLEVRIPHPLGSVPVHVLVCFTSFGAEGATLTEGTHTDKELVVTVTAGVKYKLIAE